MRKVTKLKKSVKFLNCCFCKLLFSIVLGLIACLVACFDLVDFFLSHRLWYFLGRLNNYETKF